MGNQPITLHISGSIAHCILDNPPKNEMNSSFFHALTRLRKELFPTLRVKGMIIYGRGRHFSSGADLKELASLYQKPQSEIPAAFLKKNLQTFSDIEALPFPVIAVINGCCLGAGLELALTCRFRIASRHAVFSLPESTYGLIPGCGGTIRLPKVVKTGNAVKMILGGMVIPADEAHRIGLVDSIVEKKRIMETAETMIHRLSSTLGFGPKGNESGRIDG